MQASYAPFLIKAFGDGSMYRCPVPIHRPTSGVANHAAGSESACDGAKVQSPKAFPHEDRTIRADFVGKLGLVGLLWEYIGLLSRFLWDNLGSSPWLLRGI